MELARVVWIGSLVCGCGFSSSAGGDDTDPPGTECATPIGHDEDADGVDDACDSCPGIAGTFADGDHDGVGDACDPEPIARADRQVEFVSFAGTGAGARWLAATPKWVWRDDLLHFDDMSAPLDYQVMKDTAQPASAAAFAISARVVIERVPAMKAQIGVLANVHGPGNDGLTCAVVHEMDGHTTSLAYDRSGPLKVAALPAMQVGAEYLLQLAYEPATRIARCTVNGVPADVALTAPLPQGVLGFEGANIGARVEYVVVYSHD